MSRLSGLRERAGLTQDDVSRSLGIDRSTVAKWEAGAALPRAEKLPALAKLYGCTIEQLLSEGERGGIAAFRRGNLSPSETSPSGESDGGQGSGVTGVTTVERSGAACPACRRGNLSPSETSPSGESDGGQGSGVTGVTTVERSGAWKS